MTVWCEPDSSVVVAFFAITPTQIAPDGISRSARGGELLLDALETVSAAASAGSGRVVVVDSIDDRAYEFYKHHGFTPIGETLRLFAHIPDVIASIAPSRYGPN